MKRSLPFFVCLTVAAGLFISRSSPTHSQSGPLTCPSGYSVNVNNGQTTTVTVSGFANVSVVAPTGTTQTLSRVIIRANQKPIGRAQPNSSYTWGMPWLTSLHPNGSAMVDAELLFTNAEATCILPGVPVNILNPTLSNMTAVISPASWQGPMSFSFPMSVYVNSINNFDPTQFSLFQWNATIGSINSANNQAQFSSGQTVGTGTIGALVKYGGASLQLTVPVAVKAPDAPLPAPGTTTGQTPVTSADATSTAPESISRVATLQNNPVIQDCATNAVGLERFSAINKGESRPTLEELKKLNACFASSNYILPSNFAPIAPTAIKELTKTTKLQINKPENVTKKDSAGETDTLKFSGKAKPESTVILYIFSEPLVLTTTADNDGNWTYTLEDPIESGSHEVYTVVDRGDGVYERSDPFSFVLGTAVAAEANPNGLSLTLSDTATPSQSNRSMLFFAAAAITVIFIVLIGLLLTIQRRKQKAAFAPAAEPATNIGTDEIPANDSTTPPDGGATSQ